MEEVQALETIFAQVEDPRIERTKRHRLRDILILAVCGTICGADGWVEIEEFGKAKETWFTELLNLPNGICIASPESSSVCLPSSVLSLSSVHYMSHPKFSRSPSSGGLGKKDLLG